MPASHHMHPEFGLLCPTPRLRRKLRVGLACLIFALVGGAVLHASNTPPRANSSSANSSSANSSSANSSSANSSSAMTAADRQEGAGTSLDAGQLPAATLATRPSLPAIAETGAAKNACAQDSALHRTWAYLDGKCGGGKARKPRTVRVETDRPAIAAIAIGRIAAPERVSDPASSAPSVATGPQSTPPKSASTAPAEITPSTEPPPRPAASKKLQKTPQPSTPARANRTRCALVARGARRRRRCAGVRRARLRPWRIRARGRLRLGLWSA
jgi:hypothetical protein